MGLSEDEKDALLEIFNIAVGTAASTLSEMVGSEVQLSLPDLALIERPELMRKTKSTVSAIYQDFEASFGEGRAVLTFPEEKSLGLVSALMGQETVPPEITSLEEEALTEVGNIILNACLARLSDMAREEIVVSVPRYQKADALGVIAPSDSALDGALLLSIQFDLEDRAIEGRLLFFLELDSLRTFVKSIEEQLMASGS